MTANLFKEMSASARELGDELRAVLGDHDPAVARPLLERLSTEPHESPLLVFTGLHSSGKSTLIEALTNRVFKVAIGSGVTTNDVAEYDWDGDVTLVDTPGVHAGRPHHDERAEQALQSADLVLFAVPVELFDDVLVAHLRDVLGRLDKAHQTLIVITKTGTMPPPAPGKREDAIEKALGPFEQVPWVECDAQYYLDGLDLADSHRDDSVAFIEASGMENVAALIDQFASEQGMQARLSQPLQHILAIALAASATLTDDPHEQAALQVLARQRAALSKKRIHLDDLLAARAADFRGDAVRAAARFADSIERTEQDSHEPDAVLATEMSALNGDLSSSLDRFETAVRQVLEVQFEDLASEVLQIEASPYGRVAVQLGDVDAPTFDGPSVTVTPIGGPLPAPPQWAGDLTKHVKKFSKLWGAGDGIKAAAGSNGHQIVLKVGHAFNKKFKPWEAVKTANTIGRVAKVGGAVVAVGLEAYGVLADERAAVKAEQARADRRRTITQEVLAQADGIIRDGLDAIGADLNSMFKPEFEQIDAMARVVRGARVTRSELRAQLESVQQRAEASLEYLAKQAPEL
ncbi:hypothetical protein C6I20_07700 [Aeromicrobium sp. A1-2]|uniref:GTPase n=1 Tax=Aeromicrobium sp. A1-2 TaxID=2107713 RepID=UPI000E54FD3D|nr:GTPase [Aeromicrobium sp. A1-2]AXT85079.1 hypothetical protein C6I20_07700 [Aeromicrobium sp. A1-2]